MAKTINKQTIVVVHVYTLLFYLTAYGQKQPPGIFNKWFLRLSEHLLIPMCHCALDLKADIG